MADIDKTRKIKPESVSPEQASQPVPGIAQSGLNMRVPYLIATIFIVLTALLTLLLNVAMENKRGLQQSIALRNANPLLVDARSAFGQVTAEVYSGKQAAGPPPLINESSTLSELASGDVITASSPDSGTNPKLLPVLDSGIAIPLENGEITAMVKFTDNNPQQSPLRLALTPENIAIAAVETSSALDKIIATHLDKIDYIWNSLTRQTNNQQELESAVLHYMALMDEQISELTRRVNAVDEMQRVGSAFERILYKKQGSFERILNRRFNILQRANQSHALLRAGYTRLLDELRTRHRPDLA